MNKTNLDFIQTLSIQDKKNLSQKLSKLMEEVGTLAKSVLSYESEKGHTREIATKNDIFEDLADIILVTRSIGYELGFSHEEFEDEIVRKSHKWADIQKCEARMTDNMPFEIHITVQEAEQELFIRTCKQLEVKPIILALQAEDRIIRDVMTSSVIMGNNKTAIAEMERISKGLTDAGLNVVREKIETVPWHSAAPSRDTFNAMPENCYFESHLAVNIKNKEEEDRLRDWCKNTELHLSKNAFKKREDGSYTIMATLRKYKGFREDFEMDVHEEKVNLKAIGFDVDKTIIEFSIYDTKISHDSEWLKKDKMSHNPIFEELTLCDTHYFHEDENINETLKCFAKTFLMRANLVKNKPLEESHEKFDDYTHYFFIYMDDFIQSCKKLAKDNSEYNEVDDKIFFFAANLGEMHGFTKQELSYAWRVFIN